MIEFSINYFKNQSFFWLTIPIMLQIGATLCIYYENTKKVFFMISSIKILNLKN